MNTDTILNRNAADNSVKVIGYGHSTPDCIVKLCLDTAGGNLAQAQGLVQRYVIGKAAQQKIIRAIELHVNPAWAYDDGGRAAAGFKGEAGDCVTRAIAIATGRPYREVYDALWQRLRNHAATRRDWVAKKSPRRRRAHRHHAPQRSPRQNLQTASRGDGLAVAPDHENRPGHQSPPPRRRTARWSSHCERQPAPRRRDRRRDPRHKRYVTRRNAVRLRLLEALVTQCRSRNGKFSSCGFVHDLASTASRRCAAG